MEQKLDAKVEKIKGDVEKYLLQFLPKGVGDPIVSLSSVGISNDSIYPLTESSMNGYTFIIIIECEINGKLFGATNCNSITTFEHQMKEIVGSICVEIYNRLKMETKW